MVYREFWGYFERTSGGFVAVWNQRVINTDIDLEKLSKSVKEKTKGTKGVYMRYVSEKPIEMIL